MWRCGEEEVMGGAGGGRGGGGGEVKGVGLFIGSILEFCRSQNKSCFERCLTSRFVFISLVTQQTNYTMLSAVNTTGKYLINNHVSH